MLFIVFEIRLVMTIYCPMSMSRKDPEMPGSIMAEIAMIALKNKRIAVVEKEL